MSTKERSINLFTDYGFKKTDIETNKVFYDKLTFIYLERLQETLRGEVFEQLFDSAEIARFTPEQVRSYEKSLKYYRDLKNSLDTAFDEGKEEGRAEGKEEGKHKKEREVVINGLEQGLDKKVIAALTGLSVAEIEKIEEEK